MTELIREYYLEWQFAATFGGILLFVLLERRYRRAAGTSGGLGRWVSNLGLTLSSLVVAIYFSHYLQTSGFVDTVRPRDPLLEHLPLPMFFSVLLTIFSLELLAYVFHRAMHRIPLLWRIHAVHHCDTRVDVSTSFRHHPLEVMLATLLSILLMLWLGVPEIAAYIYTGLRLLVAQFSHADIQLPERLERWLGKVIVTPDFHLVHHLSEQQYTDSNYGSITPWFDYLFVTAKRLSRTELSDRERGLEYYREAEDGYIDHLLVLPFVFKKG